MLIFCRVCMCSSLTDMGLRHATCWLEGGIRNIPITPLLSCQPALQHWKFKHWLRHKTNDRFYNWSPDNQWSSHNFIASTLLLSNMKGIQFVKKTSTAIPKGCYTVVLLLCLQLPCVFLHLHGINVIFYCPHGTIFFYHYCGGYRGITKFLMTMSLYTDKHADGSMQRQNITKVVSLG